MGQILFAGNEILLGGQSLRYAGDPPYQFFSGEPTFVKFSASGVLDSAFRDSGILVAHLPQHARALATNAIDISKQRVVYVQAYSLTGSLNWTEEVSLNNDNVNGVEVFRGSDGSVPVLVRPEFGNVDGAIYRFSADGQLIRQLALPTISDAGEVLSSGAILKGGFLVLGQTNDTLNFFAGSLSNVAPKPDPNPTSDPNQDDLDQVLAVQILKVPDVVKPGSRRITLSLRIGNTSNSRFHAKLPLRIYASAETNFDAQSAIQIADTSVNLNLRGNASGKINVTVPMNYFGDGNYHLVVMVDPENANSENAAVIAQQTSVFQKSSVDLGAELVNVQPTLSHKSVLKVKVANNGTITADGLTEIELLSQESNVNDSLARRLSTLTRNLKLKAGQSKVIKLRIDPSQITPGSQRYIAAAVHFSGVPADSNSANDAVISATLVQFV